MLKTTQDKIENLAPNLKAFLELHPDEQKWIFPILGKAEKTAIRVLEEIENHYLTYEEIANLCGIHPSTVKAILYALENGGVVFYNGSSKKYINPTKGRNRKLLKME